MFSSITKCTGRVLIAVAIGLACAPALASASPIDAVPGQDMRSPDTRDASGDAPSATGTTSPDPSAAALERERYYSSYTNDGGAAALLIAARKDLRSPDTRDVAAGREFPPTPTVVALKEIKPPAPAPGFDWFAAVAGAAASLGLILLMTAATLVVTRRRAHRDQPVAVA